MSEKKIIQNEQKQDSFAGLFKSIPVMLLMRYLHFSHPVPKNLSRARMVMDIEPQWQCSQEELINAAITCLKQIIAVHIAAQKVRALSGCGLLLHTPARAMHLFRNRSAGLAE